MGWASWMVPDLSLSEEAKLRANEFELAKAVHESPESLAALTAGLIRQCTQQQSIISKATARIAELEAKLAVLEPDDEWLAVARQLQPRPRWIPRLPW
jgi:phage shock protein A